MKMRKKILALGVVCVLVSFCALPVTSVATMTITLTDQNGQPITKNATATFFDAQENKITTIALGKPPSWSNTLHWWAHSTQAASHLRPADARQVVRVQIDAAHCVTVHMPVALAAQYIGPSVMPHGGGAAYMLYEFVRSVQMQCGT